ncbi:MAG TPA: hypothetical protein VFO16_18260 [Pseudonocardiaceae bacterium]|nr:hypothetical protein [Pseudonocardiaceae bacterium]
MVRATIPRVIRLIWWKARPDEAQAALHTAEASMGEVRARLQLTVLRTELEVGLARLVCAMRSAEAALALPGLPDESVAMASVGLIGALAMLGRADEIGPAAARGYAAAARSSELAYYRAHLVLAQVMRLRLAGYLHDAEAIAREFRDRAKGHVLGSEIGSCVLGEAELARGRVSSALRWLREARAGLGDVPGWNYICLISLTRALALSGELTMARTALADMRAQRHPAALYLEPEAMLARAWDCAAEGAVTDAITITREAAALAADRGQLAHQVLALHTAVCLGERTLAHDLSRLATRVDGPRAPVAAAHAAALAAGDTDALQIPPLQG